MTPPQLRAVTEAADAVKYRANDAQRATGGITWLDSPPLGTARLPGAAAFIGTGAARRGLINSMGIGNTMVEFWFDPMSSSVSM